MNVFWRKMPFRIICIKMTKWSCLNLRTIKTMQAHRLNNGPKAQLARTTPPDYQSRAMSCLYSLYDP